MPKINVQMKENLRIEGQYEGRAPLSWVTDVSKEYGGLQEYGSPVDMLMGSLASCILSIMGVTAKKLGVNLQDTKIEVEYVNAPDHSIASCNIIVRCPKKLDDAITVQLEKAALKCPVHRALSSNIEKKHYFYWGES